MPVYMPALYDASACCAADLDPVSMRELQQLGTLFNRPESSPRIGNATNTTGSVLPNATTLSRGPGNTTGGLFAAGKH